MLHLPCFVDLSIESFPFEILREVRKLVRYLEEGAVLNGENKVDSSVKG